MVNQFPTVRACAICGCGMSDYQVRGDKALCPTCAHKKDDEAKPIEQRLADLLKPQQPMRIMGQNCTCCPVHARRY